MNKIGVLTSGGDAPGMNPAIRSVVRTALYSNMKVVGIRRGYWGMIEGEFIDMPRSAVGDIIQRGGTVLHSGRCEEFKTKEGRDEAYKNLEEEGIEGLVVIGGDGSLRGARDINEETDIPVIGIPATIDNDLAVTEYTIGFDTAMNTILDAINKIRDTATSHERTFVVETMGRNSGFLTLMTGLAGGAESILIPEVDFDIDDVTEKINQGYDRGKLHSIILVAEGVGGDFKTNRDVHESKAFALGQEIKKRTELEVRVIILGHLQRGGRPTARDRIIASRMGAKAVELLIEGERDKMVGFNNNRITTCEIEKALREECKIDFDLYNLANILSL